jgi:hypothetical protein
MPTLGPNLQPSGDIDVNTGRGGLYFTYFSHGFYINGAAYGGHNTYNTSRQKACLEQPTAAPAEENLVPSAKPDTTFTLEISRLDHFLRFNTPSRMSMDSTNKVL